MTRAARSDLSAATSALSRQRSNCGPHAPGVRSGPLEVFDRHRGLPQLPRSRRGHPGVSVNSWRAFTAARRTRRSAGSMLSRSRARGKPGLATFVSAQRIYERWCYKRGETVAARGHSDLSRAPAPWKQRDWSPRRSGAHGRRTLKLRRPSTSSNVSHSRSPPSRQRKRGARRAPAGEVGRGRIRIMAVRASDERGTPWRPNGAAFVSRRFGAWHLEQVPARERSDSCRLWAWHHPQDHGFARRDISQSRSSEKRR